MFQRVTRFTSSLTSLTALMTVLFVVVSIPASVFAQTTADKLYFAVQKVQDRLGNSDSADEIRDLYMIRQLETESAKGFSANLGILEHALTQVSSTSAPKHIAALAAPLEDHLVNFRDALSGDLSSQISGLPTKLAAVELSVLERNRDEAINALRHLETYHSTELSYFGRHHVNKKIGRDDLQKALDEFVFAIEPGSDDEETKTRQNEFNRAVNGLRNKVSTAKKTIGATTFSYPEPQMAAVERRLADLEDSIVSYLQFQSRRRASFEEQLAIRKQAFVTNKGVPVEPNDRLYQAELGRWIGQLTSAGQLDGLVASARRNYSLPNLKISVRESLVNRLGSQSVSQLDHVDEVIVGSRAQGWSQTTGLVSLDFVNSPYSAMVRISLAGNIESEAYTKEGPVTAYTSSHGNFMASRDVIANVGNLTVYKPAANANVSSVFKGTDCLPLVTRIASQRFSERQGRAEEVASERARDRVLGQFTEQTDDALGQGLTQLEDMKANRNQLLETINNIRKDISVLLVEDKDGNIKKPYQLIDPFEMPRLFVTTTDSLLNIGAVLEGDNRLAANSKAPGRTIPCDLRIQIHESMVSNLIAPFIQDRLIENWRFAHIAESLSSGSIEMPEETDDRPFSIRFEDGRPVQVEFDNNELAITIYGKEFRQGRNSYSDPLSIKVRARVINYKGELRLSRTSKAVAEFTYDPPKDKNWDVTFRSFLQDNLDAAIGDIETPEEAFPLPDDLLFIAELLEDDEMKQQLQKMKLVEFSAENGWLTLGWNYSDGSNSSYLTHTPAIWTDFSIYESNNPNHVAPENGNDETQDSESE